MVNIIRVEWDGTQDIRVIYQRNLLRSVAESLVKHLNASLDNQERKYIRYEITERM